MNFLSIREADALSRFGSMTFAGPKRETARRENGNPSFKCKNEENLSQLLKNRSPDTIMIMRHSLVETDPRTTALPASLRIYGNADSIIIIARDSVDHG